MLYNEVAEDFHAADTQKTHSFLVFGPGCTILVSFEYGLPRNRLVYTTVTQMTAMLCSNQALSCSLPVKRSPTWMMDQSIPYSICLHLYGYRAWGRKREVKKIGSGSQSEPTKRHSFYLWVCCRCSAITGPAVFKVQRKACCTRCSASSILRCSQASNISLCMA